MTGQSGAVLDFGSQEMVFVHKLQIDPNYQRPLNQRRCESIADNFDPELFGELIISRRANGDEAVLDGQHRLGALRVMKWDDQRVPALVHTGLTREQEAEIFLRFNLQRVKPTPIDLFHAAVASGDPGAIAVKKSINRVGMEVASGTSISLAGAPGKYVNCIGKMMDVQAALGTEAIDLILDVTTTTWGVSHTSVSAHIVDGLARFIAVHGGNINIPHLVKTLTRMGPMDVLSQARSLLSVSGARLGVSVAMVIETRYNSRAGGFRVADTTVGKYGQAMRRRDRVAAVAKEQSKTQPRVNGKFVRKAS